MTTDQVANLHPLAHQHLADAQLHLRRCLIEVKAAAQADPTLVVRLGSRYAVLAEQLRELEQQAPCGGA